MEDKGIRLAKTYAARWRSRQNSIFLIISIVKFLTHRERCDARVENRLEQAEVGKKPVMLLWPLGSIIRACRP